MTVWDTQVPATASYAALPAAARVLAVDLESVGATDPSLTGSKAAALAVARTAGLRTLPGVVLTTRFGASVDPADGLADHPAVVGAHTRLGGDRRRLVARSSSLVEDRAESSMAGQFASVIGTDGLEGLAQAVGEVLRSADLPGVASGSMAVLIQPLLEPAVGGVLFGVDPVTGRADRRVVSAVRGGPEPLVSGRATGSLYELDPRGRTVTAVVGDGPRLSRRQLRALSALADRVRSVFDGPQDVEWAIDQQGELWVLQSRPVTTEIRGVPQGATYTPGPVAEVFPDPLSLLEQDLWLPPLREALHETAALAGGFTRRQLRSSDVLIAVGGRVAIDARFAVESHGRPTFRQRLNPVHAAREVGRAWRVGRLKAALPALADGVIVGADRDLEAVPSLETLSTGELVALLRRSRGALRSLHAHEILVGMLLDSGRHRLTATGVAIEVLNEARSDGWSDATIVEREPVVLALSPARVSPSTALPAPTDRWTTPLAGDPAAADEHGLRREALRLRVRWMQELTGRAAWELAIRLSRRGLLCRPEDVRSVTLGDLLAAAEGGADLRSPCPPEDFVTGGEPLPARFRLSATGRVIAMPADAAETGGVGAGGGRGIGPVTHDAADPPEGSVLVTTTLSPGLGPLLPRLRGIVAETGSVLSHLAILSRESGVPTVVAHPGAMAAFTEGSVVLVDGDSGQVEVVAADRPAAEVGP